MRILITGAAGRIGTAVVPILRGHSIVWGVSRNTRLPVSLEAGRRIGFEPVDDAERWADALAHELGHASSADLPGIGDSPLGGPESTDEDDHPLGATWQMARIGTSGWSYDHWSGVLYPPGLPPARRLDAYLASFDTVELNASFYRWPRPAVFGSWRRRLPPGFAMVVKAPRGLTHARRLYEPEVWIERIAAGWRELGPVARMLLVQLHPKHERDDARLDHFLGAMPREIPVAVEFRHASWHVEEVFRILERHGSAYCVMSGARLPCILRATAPTVYVRLHGPDHEHLYAGSYSDDDLRWWADRIREWESAGHDVLAYFNNDGEGHAVRNAWALRSFLA